MLPALCGLGFLLLCGGLYYVYERESVLAGAVAENDPARVAALETQLRAYGQRIDAVEKRPAPASAPSSAQSSAPQPAAQPDLGPIQGRLDEVERRVQALTAQPNAAAPTQVAGSPAPGAPDIGPLASRLDTLEQRVQTIGDRPPPPPPDLGAAVAPLAAQLQSLTGREQSVQTAQTAALDRMAAMEKRLAEAEQRAATADQRAATSEQRAVAAEQRATQADQRLGQVTTQATQVAAEATRASRVQLATASLAAGQPLGDIPGAPPALVRYFKQRPPTEPALRLSFPAAAEQAAAASRPSSDGQSLGQRMWGHAQALVTIREGNKVLVGAPAMTILATARERLDAGDLAGCVNALNGLDGPAAEAIADWRDQAQALLDARAALAAMARG